MSLPTPYYEEPGITIYHGDCLDILPSLQKVDVVLTDPPYLTGDARVPILGRGVSERCAESASVGLPWGYSLGWTNIIHPSHWVVFSSYHMLAGLCAVLPPSCVFVWRKSNAPTMTRPVPRHDCEFIVWSRSESATCERMGEFKSMVIDVPMLQAGCFASERILATDSLSAAHPCQKPLSVIAPFIMRLDGVILDPFMGSGTTLRAAKDLGRKAIGIEIEEKYCQIAVDRLRQEVLAL